MAIHSSTIARKIPWMEEHGRLQSMGVTKSWTRLSDSTFHFLGAYLGNIFSVYISREVTLTSQSNKDLLYSSGNST